MSLDPKDISIKELILKLWLGKWIILIVTGVCLLIGALFTYIIFDKIYTSRAVIAVTQSDNLKISTETVIQQLTSGEYLTQVIQENDLKGTNGELLSVDKLSGLFNAYPVGADGIEVSVNSSSPELSMKAANAIANNIDGFVASKLRSSRAADLEYYEQQEGKINQTVQSKIKALESFIKEHGNVDRKKNELDNLRQQLANYQTEMYENQKNIMTNEKYLSSLYDRADKVGLSISKVNLEVSLSDGSVDVINDTSVDELDKAMLSMEIADCESNLLNQKAREIAIEEQLETMGDKLDQKQNEYLEIQFEYEALNNEYTAAKDAYASCLKAQNEARAIEAVAIESYISLRADAALPESPSGPNHRNQLAIAGAIGFLLGAGFVLLRAWLLGYKTMKNKGI